MAQFFEHLNAASHIGDFPFWQK